MKNITYFITIVVFLFSCKPKKYENKPKETYRVIAYVAGWTDVKSLKIQPDKLTHINYAFAIIKDGKVTYGSEESMLIDAQNLAILVKLKEKNPKLKIMISVGGWGGSGGFSDAALTKDSRELFAKTAVEYMIRHKLDGVDVDWEYPGLAGAGNKFRSEDKENFSLLIKELRRALDRQGLKDDRHYEASIASGGFPDYMSHTNLAEVHRNLDFINIMTYDFYHGWDSTTGHHANLFVSDKVKQTKGLSARRAVELHKLAGVPTKKIVLGVAFYGRQWKGVKKNSTNGFFQEAKTGGSGIQFNQLDKNYINKNSFVRYWDSTAQTPYLWSADSAIFISYDDEESLTLKNQYIRDNKLGGVMFWEYSGDNESKLLNKVSELPR